MRILFTYQPLRYSLAADREIEIVQELLERILVYSEGMRHACDVCAELDCILAFAEASRAHNYCRPQMTVDPIIDIDQGR